MRRLLWAGGTIFAVCCLTVAAAPSALAVVLVNQHRSRVCVGKTFQVGVWYQEYSGGSRAYRLDVYNPHGKRVLYKHGKARSSAWEFWNVRANMAGRYRTVYHPLQRCLARLPREHQKPSLLTTRTAGSQ
jgi:hypothetical protein